MNRISWARVVLPELQLLDVMRQVGVFGHRKAKPPKRRVPSFVKSAKVKMHSGVREDIEVVRASFGPETAAQTDGTPSWWGSGPLGMGAPTNGGWSEGGETGDLILDAFARTLAASLGWRADIAAQLAVAASPILAASTSVGPPAAVLLVGAAGVGKSYVARRFASALAGLEGELRSDAVVTLDGGQVTSAEALKAFLTTQLAPQLKPGVVIVLDNIDTAHASLREMLTGILSTASAETTAGPVRADGVSFVLTARASLTPEIGEGEVGTVVEAALGAELMGAVQATLLLPTPSYDQLVAMADEELQHVVAWLKREKSVDLSLRAGVARELAARGQAYATFGHAIAEAVAGDLKAALAAKAGELGASIELGYEDGRFVATGDGKRAELTDKRKSRVHEVFRDLGAPELESASGRLSELATRLAAAVREDSSRGQLLITGASGLHALAVAKSLGRALWEEGALATGHVIEVGREDLVADDGAQTAARTRETVQRARGGVLLVAGAASVAVDDKDLLGNEALRVIGEEASGMCRELRVAFADDATALQQLLDRNRTLAAYFTENIDLSMGGSRGQAALGGAA